MQKINTVVFLFVAPQLMQFQSDAADENMLDPMYDITKRVFDEIPLLIEESQKVAMEYFYRPNLKPVRTNEIPSVIAESKIIKNISFNEFRVGEDVKQNEGAFLCIFRNEFSVEYYRNYVTIKGKIEIVLPEYSSSCYVLFDHNDEEGVQLYYNYTKNHHESPILHIIKSGYLHPKISVNIKWNETSCKEDMNQQLRDLILHDLNEALHAVITERYKVITQSLFHSIMTFCRQPENALFSNENEYIRLTVRPDYDELSREFVYDEIIIRGRNGSFGYAIMVQPSENIIKHFIGFLKIDILWNHIQSPMSSRQLYLETEGFVIIGKSYGKSKIMHDISTNCGEFMTKKNTNYTTVSQKEILKELIKKAFITALLPQSFLFL